MAVPLDLSINPMSVLQDPLIGRRCRAMFDEGDVDDRFLMILFLTVERLRSNSPWRPYIDVLPTSFGNPLWFTEDELVELKGTTLHRASVLQRKNLQALYDDKVKFLVDELLPGDDSLREVQFEDFLWANSIFWTRALSIPFPRSYVFPGSLGDQNYISVCHNCDFGASEEGMGREAFDDRNGGRHMDNCVVLHKENNDEISQSEDGETLWVEGLVPGIDFCNHVLKPEATWDVDRIGSLTGIPSSMYLLLANPREMEMDKEICISYGSKGNEELLYLYGFTIDNNPSDFLMVNYPFELLQSAPLSVSKAKLLELQKAELRCLLPRTLLDTGFFTGCPKDDKCQLSNFSWSGQRKVPSYAHKLVFPQEFMAALRIISMQDHEMKKTTSLLEELVGSTDWNYVSATDVQTAVWETCGDYAAFELLVDLLRVKITELEEGSGTEEADSKLLEDYHHFGLEGCRSFAEMKCATRKQRDCLVYRKGQKQLARLFLQEAEHALELCASEPQ